jgi:hypothetical protein
VEKMVLKNLELKKSDFMNEGRKSTAEIDGIFNSFWRF